MGHRLSKIVTRTGDSGTTGLADGSRVDKDTPRLEAVGTIDELNSCIGFAVSQLRHNEELIDRFEPMAFVQHDLFDLGAALSTPGRKLLLPSHVERLDEMIERWNATLPPLKEFILPSGSPAVGAMHLARCVCRRAERRLVTFFSIEPQDDSNGLVYLNRLSDFLFIAARIICQIEGHEEKLWEAKKGTE